MAEKNCWTQTVHLAVTLSRIRLDIRLIYEGKEKEKKKELGEEKKAMGALLVFIMATLEICFGRKKLLDANGSFGGNVIQNPA